MAASGAPVRQPRRGPAPIASFDHDGSDESSPETKQPVRLPEIVEDSSSAGGGPALAPPEQRARSHSTPAAALGAPPAPRIDISRASSSSHHDSRDSSPELALFAGAAPQAAEGLGFREDGALDLRSSTEELAFLEPAPGERPPPPAPPARRHSRKDSQGSEAALLAVSGRTSRLSSVGSQCSAHSALSGFSRVSRLSVASGASRSPSPHRMLLETSFCGPKPIETDPEACAAAVEERLLEMAKLSAAPAPPAVTVTVAPAPPAAVAVVASVVPAPVDARDRREVRTEATVERPAPRPPAARTAPAPVATPAPVPAPQAPITPAPVPDDDKRQKETKNRVRAEERRARSRERRDDSGESRTKSQSKDIIRIRLKPSEEYDDDDDDDATECAAAGSAPKPATLELGAGPRPARPTDFEATAPAPRRPRDSRTPSPAGVVVSRKSSFCSLFKSRETIASPESPSDALRRKKSLNEGRSRSRSRDRSATPTSATKIRGSVLSLFKTPRRSAASPSPSSREGSPVVQPPRPAPQQPPRAIVKGEKLKYYEDAKDGIIHIPLRTPPDEAGGPRTESDARPASAPQQRVPPVSIGTSASTSGHAARSPSKPIQRTVLPDGSIIIPLRSPTEKTVEDDPLSPVPVPAKTPEESRPAERTSRSSSTVEVVSAVVSPGQLSASSGPASASTGDAASGPSAADVTPSPDPPPDAPPERARSRRERLIFTTHVGSAERVFCTQFSITKTPSVTSEISGSFPSFPDVDEPVAATPAAASASVATPTTPAVEPAPPAELPRGSSGCGAEPVAGSSGASPQEGGGRDSSESEASSEAAPARGGNDVERRGLVVQESFEDELPYVPTTLPQERSLALPMVPVRERGGVRVAPVERPRAAAPRPSPVPRAPRVPPVPLVPAAPPTTPAPRVSVTEDKIRIKLPRRPRTASASAAPPRPERTRARSGSDGQCSNHIRLT
ncbi:hypothetical protein ABMA28_004247 [Loxostege sticticalis]|uniref:Uncharacterized protein n=1 Tax=Loxostege sticticalis TaxID=481309 RepID=A0ABD0SV80_LOXSC